MVKSKNDKRHPIDMYFQEIVVTEKHGLQQQKLLMDEDALVRWESRTTLYIGAKSQYRVHVVASSRKTISVAQETNEDIYMETPSYIFVLREPIYDDEKKWLQFQHRVLAMDPNNKQQKDSTSSNSTSRNAPMSSSRGPRKSMSGGGNHGFGKNKQQQQQQQHAMLPNSSTYDSINNHPIRRGRAYGRNQQGSLTSTTPLSATSRQRTLSSSILPSDDDDENDMEQQLVDDNIVMQQQEEDEYSPNKKRTSHSFHSDDDDDSLDTDKPRFQKKNNNARNGGNNNTQSTKRLRKTPILDDDDDDENDYKDIFDDDNDDNHVDANAAPTTGGAGDDEKGAAAATSGTTKDPTKKQGKQQGTLRQFFSTKNPVSKSTTLSNATAAPTNVTSTPRLSISDGQEHQSGSAATTGTRSTSASDSLYHPSSSSSCASPPRDHETATNTASTLTPPRTSRRRGEGIPDTARKSSRSKKRSNISSTFWLSQQDDDFNNNDDDDENDPFTNKKKPTDNDGEVEDILDEYPVSPPQASTAKGTSSSKNPLDLLDSVPQSLTARYQQSNQASFGRSGGIHPRLYNRAGKNFNTTADGITNNIRRGGPPRQPGLGSSNPFKSPSCWDPSKTPLFNRHRSNPTLRPGLFGENDSPSTTLIVLPNPCRGLRNLGNTCYMNASLQMLYTLTDFCGSLVHLREAAETIEASATTTTTTTLTNNRTTTLPLTTSVNSIYKMLRKQATALNKSPVHPGSVKEAMDALTDKFVGYEQRDAHEFLSDLIDFLHEEHLKAKKTIFAVAAAVPSLPPAPPLPPLGAASTTNNGINVSPDGTARNKENYNEQVNEQQPGVADMAMALSLAVGDDDVQNDTAIAMTDDASKEELLQDAVVPSFSSTACPADDDDFRLTAEVGLTCLSCGYFRRKEEIYRHLSLDIIAPVTNTESSNTKGSNSNKKARTTITPCSLAASLEHFFQSETREINCEKCTKGTHASQSLRVLKRPKALLLHLKRFIVVEKPQPLVDDDSDKVGGDENAHPNSPSSRRSRPVVMEYEFQKNKAPVEIAERLSLAKFLSTSEETETSLLGEYKIQSIVHHIGSRASSGHYTADALRPSKDLISPDVDDEDAYNKVEDGNKDDGDKNDPSGNVKHDDDGLGSGAAIKTNENKGNGDESLSASAAAGQEQEEWISFDDTNSARNTFENIAGSNFKQRTAYMLLYKFSPATSTSPAVSSLQESCKIAEDSAPPAEPMDLLVD